MNLPNKLTISRIFIAIIILVMLCIPWHALGFTWPVYLVNNVTFNLKYIIAGILFLIFCNIFLVSEANRINNRINNLQEENSCLEAEIDSLRNEITDSTTLDKLEKTASKKYGMVYPNSSNYVKIKDESKSSSNLASTIKDEVYG